MTVRSLSVTILMLAAVTLPAWSVEAEDRESRGQLQTSTLALTGTLVEFHERKHELVVKVDRRRHRLYADRHVRVTADGKPVKRQWLRPRVPIRVLIADSPAESSATGRRRARRRTDDNRPIVAEVLLQTAHATGRITSVQRKRNGRFRIKPDRAPTSQPTTTSAPTTSTALKTSAARKKSNARSRRQRPRRSLTFVRDQLTQIRRKGKSTLFSKVRKGEYVEVTYLPGERQPRALTINILRQADRPAGSVVRIRRGRDGKFEAAIDPKDAPP